MPALRILTLILILILTLSLIPNPKPNPIKSLTLIQTLTYPNLNPNKMVEYSKI